MALIKSISLKNFKCYRENIKFELGKSSFFVGTNNSGKSAVLKGIHCFFDDNQFDNSFLNKTVLRSKGAGYNQSEISIDFDLGKIPHTPGLQKKLIASCGPILSIKKNFVFKETTGRIAVSYQIKSKKSTEYELLPEDIRKFLKGISISYIHPQESKELLATAQAKLKNRLLSNWGTTAAISDTLAKLQENWVELKSKTNSLLSKGLTESLQNIWPGSTTKVDLPESINEIIGISEILFKGEKSQPEVSLTAQGTGAQSTILYQTHFLLDSDKSLHRGFYYPVWLLEEPESFLHADIIIKLGQLLSSETWLNNIQMLISTHSPQLLATTHQNKDIIRWHLLNNHLIVKSKMVCDWKPNDITQIGILMGDPNFDVYFTGAVTENLFFIEDMRSLTLDKFVESGIQITKALNGSSEIKRYFDVYKSFRIHSTGKKITFILDNDEGAKEFRPLFSSASSTETSDQSNFKLYSFPNDLRLLLFPDNFSVEDLFDEYSDFVVEQGRKIMTPDFLKASEGSIPGTLSRVHVALRKKIFSNRSEAITTLKKQQEIKDLFWTKVKSNKYLFSKKYVDEMLGLINA